MEHRLLRSSRRRITAVAAALTLAVGSAAVAAAPVQAASPNLIVNGGFEDGLASWFANDGNASDTATLSTTTDAYSGTGAVLVTNRSTTGSGPMQNLSGKVQAGKTYLVTARVKYENPNSPATKQFFITMHYGGSTYTNLGTVTVPRGQWGLIQGTFTIPAGQNVSTARIFVETPWTANPSTAPDTHLMNFKVDDVTLQEYVVSKTIEVVGKLPGEHNPLIGHKFGADGFGFVHDGRVYLYMTNDTQGYAPNPATGVSPGINYGDINQITVISSADLVNWTDHGEIQVAGPNGVAPFTGNSWAPGIAKKVVNGEEKFFLYYANGGGSSNVITGKSPLGPWTSERTSTLINGSTPGAEDVAWKFDPAPLVDDDGQAYLYFGGGPASTSMPAVERFNNPKNIRSIKLNDNMVATEGRAAVVDAPVAFEAGHVFKREGKYYFSYSSHFGGNDFGGNQPRVPGYPGGGQIGYMISDNPMSWPKETYAGVLFPNQSQFFGAGTGGNNHQSVFEFEGKYYFTYHAPTLNKRINGNTTQGYRSPHIQELTFNPDGTIQQVVGDYAGVDQVRNFNPYRVFEAETLGWSKGIATGKVDGASAEFGTAAPNLVVRDIDEGDWTALSAVDFGADGAASVTAKVRALAAGGSIEVRLDNAGGPVVGTIPVDTPTGEWAEVTADLQGATGVHDVYFTYRGPAGDDLFEIDSWAFEAVPPLDLSVTADTRCVGEKVMVTVRAANNEAIHVTASAESAYGTRPFGSVPPGKDKFRSFPTDAAAVPAGVVTVTATATVDGEPVSASYQASYPARSCG
ncbi:MULTISPECIES: family 43 glycosylhydrolase [Micromonospora]|uniref:Carbohydrate-binding protein n=1 Tax=Micromonospora sicca TaxID=2202420 RepID=A0A317DR37_9ACTN|nr:MULTISPECIES: family 43 glycosylhydrolase [unclassified Micromonospora]MBM0224569.1 family 43 glycosylhydrolase [Micromonospora sp. ATA51]PWR15355.1 carbohydrate-binding protein [Micromonospora sp. 4G51]